MSSLHNAEHVLLRQLLLGGPSSTQPIAMITPPKFVADGGTLKQDVPALRVAGTYSSGAITSRYRTRGSPPNEVTVSNGADASYTPVSADVGQYMTYYEVVTNEVTSEVKTFASSPVGPILTPDPTAPGEVQAFDFTSGTAHGVTVARAAITGTRRSGAATVEVMGSNTKRYEHNSSGTQIGLLCEKAATNQFSNGDDVSAVVTATANATKTSNYGTAPDGTTSSTRVVVTAGGASRGVGLGVSGLTGNVLQKLWVKGTSGQEFVISDSDSGAYVYVGPTNGAWQLYEDQGTSTPGSNYLNWRLYNSGTSALDVEVWGVGLQIPVSGTLPNYQTLILTSGAAASRAKETWTVTLAVGSVTRDIQIEDHLGQVQNFTGQVIGGGATWTLDADSVTISPVIAHLRVYTNGTLSGTPPPAAPPPAPAPSGGDYPTISLAGLIASMELNDDASYGGFTLPSDRASIQTPLNIDGVEYLCNYPRIDGQGPSNFYNEWDAVPIWMWLYLSNEWPGAFTKRIQYRRLMFCLLLDSPTGPWVSSQVHQRLGSPYNTQLWLGRSGQGAPFTTLNSMQRDESEEHGGGSSVLLSNNQGVEMWANPGFYAMLNRAYMARAYSGAAIAEIRVINDDRTVYTGSDAKPLAALGGDLYAPNPQNPRLDNSGIPRASDGFKSRWRKVDCTGGWTSVAMVTCDFCSKKDGPRPPQWGNYTGSWAITGSAYNLTKAQLTANPPPFVV